MAILSNLKGSIKIVNVKWTDIDLIKRKYVDQPIGEREIEECVFG